MKRSVVAGLILACSMSVMTGCSSSSNTLDDLSQVSRVVNDSNAEQVEPTESGENSTEEVEEPTEVIEDSTEEDEKVVSTIEVEKVNKSEWNVNLEGIVENMSSDWTSSEVSIEGAITDLRTLKVHDLIERGFEFDEDDLAYELESGYSTMTSIKGKSKDTTINIKVVNMGDNTANIEYCNICWFGVNLTYNDNGCDVIFPNGIYLGLPTSELAEKMVGAETKEGDGYVTYELSEAAYKKLTVITDNEKGIVKRIELNFLADYNFD